MEYLAELGVKNAAKFISKGAYISLLLKCIEDGKKRPTDSRFIDIAIVLDISGSMNSAVRTKSRLDLAKDSVHKLIEVMHPEDQLSLTTFNDRGHLIFPLTKIEQIKSNKAFYMDQVNSITVSGGTILSSGFQVGVDQYKTCDNNADNFESECKSKKDLGRIKRLVMLTDMCCSGDELKLELVKAAERGI
mmetsp:Transcript_103182/g.222794  ORF Transcript_103182/g.222794 Transcript_103182/m.222794 type:complete len:190 (-) Transcript_103182:779-1348(-)